MKIINYNKKQELHDNWGYKLPWFKQGLGL